MKRSKASLNFFNLYLLLKRLSAAFQGNLRAYELWPHIFPLNADHMKSTMKSSRNSTGLLDALSSILRDDETTESNSSVEKGQQLLDRKTFKEFQSIQFDKIT